MIPAQVDFMLENFYHEIEIFQPESQVKQAKKAKLSAAIGVVSMLTYFVFVTLTHAMLRSNYKPNVRREAQSLILNYKIYAASS
jgi:hypothetical protein